MASQDRQMTAWSPFRPMLPAESGRGWDDFMGLAPISALARMSRMMDSFLGDAPALMGLPLDLTETDDAYILTVEMPGVNKDEITIESRDHVLTIRGEKKSAREESAERGYRMERRYGVFMRSIALPEDADLDRISAMYQDGVLRIEIQKRPETKPKTIPIGSQSAARTEIKGENRSEKKRS